MMWVNTLYDYFILFSLKRAINYNWNCLRVEFKQKTAVLNALLPHLLHSARNFQKKKASVYDDDFQIEYRNWPSYYHTCVYVFLI